MDVILCPRPGHVPSSQERHVTTEAVACPAVGRETSGTRQQPGPAVSCQTGSDSVTGRQRGERERESVVTGLWRLWRPRCPVATGARRHGVSWAQAVAGLSPGPGLSWPLLTGARRHRCGQWQLWQLTVTGQPLTCYITCVCVCVVYTPHPLNSSNVICVASCQILKYDFFICCIKIFLSESYLRIALFDSSWWFLIMFQRMVWFLNPCPPFII